MVDSEVVAAALCRAFLAEEVGEAESDPSGVANARHFRQTGWGDLTFVEVLKEHGDGGG